MDCKKAEELLVDYLYRELSAKKTVEIEKHLQVCDRCKKTLESWKTIHTTYQKTTIESQVSPFLKQRILHAAEEALATKPSFAERLFAFFRPAIVLPILLFGLLAVLYMTLQKGPEIAQAKKVAPAKASVPMSEQVPAALSDEAEQKRNAQVKSLGYVTGGKNLGKDKEARLRLAEKQKGEAYSLESMKETAKIQAEDLRRDQPAARASELQPPPAFPAESPPPPEVPATSEVSPALMAEAKMMRAGSGADSSFQQAQSYFRTNNLKEGWNYAQQAIVQDREKALASEFHQYGIQYQNNHEYDKAIVQYKLILDHYQNYSAMEDVLTRLGDSYTEIGDLNEAGKTYQQLMSSYPQNKVAPQKVRELKKKQEAQKQLQSLSSSEQ